MTRDPTAVAFSIFSPAALGSASERAAPTDCSTMSAFAVDEAQHLGALRGRNLESVEGGLEMANKAPPVALADAHPAMRGLHVAADVIERAARAISGEENAGYAL
jgi:hypothetical protein